MIYYWDSSKSTLSSFKDEDEVARFRCNDKSRLVDPICSIILDDIIESGVQFRSANRGWEVRFNYHGDIRLICVNVRLMISLEDDGVYFYEIFNDGSIFESLLFVPYSEYNLKFGDYCKLLPAGIQREMRWKP